MKKLIFLLSISVIGFSSCQPGDPPPKNTHFYEEYDLGLGVTEKICDGTGIDCAVKKDQIQLPWVFGRTLRTYIDADNVSTYFLTQNWQADLPELVGIPNLVSRIINTNAKMVVDQDNSLVILKDRNLPRIKSNILFVIVNKNIKTAL
jgi:hypothetical protein